MTVLLQRILMRLPFFSIDSSQEKLRTVPQFANWHTLRLNDPAHTAESADFAEPAGPGARAARGGARSVRITRPGVAAPKPGAGVPLIRVPGFWSCVYDRKAGNPHMGHGCQPCAGFPGFPHMAASHVRAVAQQHQQLPAVGPQPANACNS
jgi:hypothetical protein